MLRTHKLGEADRIITLLTRRHGRVRAVAKGVRRTKSKFGASVEPFSHVDLQLYAGRELDIVTQAEIMSPFGATLAGDYGSWTAAQAIVETVERLTAEEREPALRLYLLLVGALRTLADAEHESRLVLDAFLLRAMAASGYEPSLDDCARCSAAGPHAAFAVGAGGVVCAACRPPGSATPSPRSLVLLHDLLTGDWAGADASDPRARREGSGLVAAYVQWHLERGLRSLPMVERA